ncbi:putative Protein phosphatase 2C [Paratrimastix pyriformis]|uniref:PPM-type phosphatase domain-containing protein n=1 Tax=Paratrimastix pyriformis TaxID=342808 RepID=A0ABQ8URT0_9EUKA|nr:putative Protein phosphatase 2C [Paratrimastix pyriformis]
MSLPTGTPVGVAVGRKHLLHCAEFSGGPASLRLPLNLDIAACSERKSRMANEDRWCRRFHDQNSPIHPMCMAAVFDGHGGPFVAEFMSNRLPLYLMGIGGLWNMTVDELGDHLANQLRRAEAELRQVCITHGRAPHASERPGDCGRRDVGLGTSPPGTHKAEASECGSTGVVVLQRGRDLFVANVGDSYACLYSQNADAPEMVTRLHKPDLEEERRRIIAAKGRVLTFDTPRLCAPAGSDVPIKLSLSRAFGDFTMKQFGLSAEPEIRHIVLTPAHRAIVLCSDGVDMARCIEAAPRIPNPSSTLILVAASLLSPHPARNSLPEKDASPRDQAAPGRPAPPAPPAPRSGGDEATAPAPIDLASARPTAAEGASAPPADQPPSQPLPDSQPLSQSESHPLSPSPPYLTAVPPKQKQSRSLSPPKTPSPMPPLDGMSLSPQAAATAGSQLAPEQQRGKGGPPSPVVRMVRHRRALSPPRALPMVTRGRSSFDSAIQIAEFIVGKEPGADNATCVCLRFEWLLPSESPIPTHARL